jgi:hypothetical protein
MIINNLYVGFKMQPPDHDHVGILLRIWSEVKSTPPEVIVGFIAFLTGFLKILGKTVNKRVEINPIVTREEMDVCKTGMEEHFDKGIHDVHERIDDIYKILLHRNKTGGS